MESSVNCATQCVNGCLLAEKCPNREYAANASQFINTISLDKMHEMAKEAVRKKRLAEATAEPKWVIPDFLND